LQRNNRCFWQHGYPILLAFAISYKKLLLGKVDFGNLYLNLSGEEYASLKAAQEAGAATLNYGSFLNTVINFVIVAFAIFLLIKGVNSARRKEEEAPADPTDKDCPHCLSKVPLKATRCAHCTSELQAA